jgi:hypothetical protein
MSILSHLSPYLATVPISLKIYGAPVAEVSVVLPEVGLAWPHHPDGHQLESLLLKPEIRLSF